MSAGNYFETRRKAFNLRTKDVTATYTTRAGGASDNFIEDRVITSTDPSASFTVTVSNGTYEGQRFLATFLSDASSVTVTIDPALGDTANYAMTAAGDYVILQWSNATTGWVTIKEVTT